MIPLINSMDAKGILIGQSIFLAVLGAMYMFFPPFVSVVVPMGIFMFACIVMCTSRGIACRNAKRFLRNRSSSGAANQRNQSWDYFHEISERSAWIPVFGLFLFHEQFSPILRRLRETYETMYWGACIDEAQDDARKGHIHQNLLALAKEESIDVEEKYTILRDTLDIFYMIYLTYLNEQKKRIEKGCVSEQMEEKLIRQGNKEKLRIFYASYEPISEKRGVFLKKRADSYRVVVEHTSRIIKWVVEKKDIDFLVEQVGILSNRTLTCNI